MDRLAMVTKSRLNSGLLVMALQCVKLSAGSSDIFPHTRLWIVAMFNKIWQKMNNIRAPTVLQQHHQTLRWYSCHLYDPHFHFAEHESCKISEACNYIMHKLSTMCFLVKKWVKMLHNICIEMVSFSRYASPTDGVTLIMITKHSPIYSICNAYSRARLWPNDCGIHAWQTLQHAQELILHDVGHHHPNMPLFRWLQQCLWERGSVIPSALVNLSCPSTVDTSQ